MLSALTHLERRDGADALKLIDQATLETALDKEKIGTPVSADPAICLWCTRGGTGKVIISCVRGQPLFRVPSQQLSSEHLLTNKMQGPCNLTDSPSGLALPVFEGLLAEHLHITQCQGKLS